MSASTDLSSLSNQTHRLFATGGDTLPSGTTAQRPATAQDGTIRYNITTKAIEYFGNSVWQNVIDATIADNEYVRKDAPVFTADLNANGFKLGNIASPTDPGDAVSLGYLEARFADGTGINADTLDGIDSTGFVTQPEFQPFVDAVIQLNTDLTTHIADQANPHQVTKDQVGLGQVEDIAPLDMPVSGPQQTALNGKVNKGGDTMQGNLNMGGYNFIGAANFVGMIGWFAFNGANTDATAGGFPPAGWLHANGQLVLRADYPRLFERIGTQFNLGIAGEDSTNFRLPDLRGMFVRGLSWSPAPIVLPPNTNDPGRVLSNTPQAGAFGNHTHAMTVTSAGAHTHTGTAATAGAHTHDIILDQGSVFSTIRRGITQINNQGSYIETTESAGAHTHTLTINTAGAHTHAVTAADAGGSETRPVNIAMVPCIMY